MALWPSLTFWIKKAANLKPDGFVTLTNTSQRLSHSSQDGVRVSAVLTLGRPDAGRPSCRPSKSRCVALTGDVGVDIPRDRNGAFQPATVLVVERRLTGVDQMAISLYAKGLMTGDIASHLFELYDKNTDRSTISRDHGNPAGWRLAYSLSGGESSKFWLGVL